MNYSERGKFAEKIMSQLILINTYIHILSSIIIYRTIIMAGFSYNKRRYSPEITGIGKNLYYYPI